MQSNPSFQLYHALTPKEKDQFRQWLPIFAQKAEAFLPLLDGYEQKLPRDELIAAWQGQHPGLSREAASKEISSRSNQLKPYLERFLASEAFRHQPKEGQAEWLLAVLASRYKQLPPSLLAGYRKQLKPTKPRANSHADYHRRAYEYYREEHNAKINESKDTRENRIPRLSQHLDKWWLFERIPHFMAKLSRYYLGQLSEDITWEDLQQEYELIREVANPYFPDTSLQHLLKMIDLAMKNRLQIHAVLTETDRLSDHLSQHDVRDLFLFLINYLMRRTRPLNLQEVNQQLAILYQWAIHQDIFQEGMLPMSTHYLIILNVYAELKEFDKAIDMAINLQPLLHQDEQDTLYPIGLMRIHYHQRDWDAISDLVDQLANKRLKPDLEREVRVRTWMVQYELKNRHELPGLLKRDREWLRQQKGLNQAIRTGLINQANQLLGLLQKESHDELMQIRQRIVEMNPLNSKSWVLEKVDEKIQGLGGS